MTVTQYRVLLTLIDAPQYPNDLYPVVSPRGRHNTDVDHGSSKGGPSRRECVVNWYLGKMQQTGWVHRYGYANTLVPGELRGKWMITDEGRRAMERPKDLRQ